MIRRLITMFLFAVVTAASAGQVEKKSVPGYTLNLQQTTLQAFVSVVYGDILKEPFLLDDSIKQAVVSISYKNADPESIRTVLDAYLAGKGMRRTVQAGVNVFLPAEVATAAPVAPSGVPGQVGMPRDVAGLVRALEEKKKPIQHAFFLRVSHRPVGELLKVLTPLLGPDGRAVESGDDGLLLLAEADRLTLARGLLDQFDRPTGEVLVRATVIEYTNSDDDGAGFFGALKLLGGKLGVSIGDKTSGPSMVSFKNNTIEAVLSIVSQDSRFSVVDSSSLRVQSGKSARLTVGQEVPVLSQFTTDQKGNAVQAVQYRTSGLVLEVKPLTLGERVTAEVNQTVSSFAITRTSNIDSPTLLKREFGTTLSADFGELVFLGGLDERKSTDAQSGLMGLKLSRSASKTSTTLFLVLQFSKA